MQDENKMHWLIIGILSVSVILLLMHIKDMQPKTLGLEGFDATQNKEVMLEGVAQLSTPTAIHQELLDAAAEDGIDSLENPWIGESTLAEKSQDAGF